MVVVGREALEALGLLVVQGRYRKEELEVIAKGLIAQDLAPNLVLHLVEAIGAIKALTVLDALEGHVPDLEVMVAGLRER